MMATNKRLDSMREDDGSLPSYAWPGGYPLYYITRDGCVVCPTCANAEVDDSQAVIDGDVNWEDIDMYCEDCHERIESAYAED